MKQEFPKELAETIKSGDSYLSWDENDLEIIIWETILIKENGRYYKYDLESALKHPLEKIRNEIEDYFSYMTYNNKQILDNYNENRNLTNKN